jgi:hypothetical protein
MVSDPSPAALIGRIADERLLAPDGGALPADVGRPEAIPQTRIRARLVGVGATLTGLALVSGLVLIVLGGIDFLASHRGLPGLIAFIVGVLLTGTHWGWVHVAEATADSIEGRRNGELLVRRRQWLESIEPFARHEVTTSVAGDGAITIERICHRPVPSGETAFSFVRELEGSELHSGDEPAAVVTERAELLRRQAALDTERERGRYQTLADAHEREMLEREDDDQRTRARAAASQALSEQINSNLRDPPLIE